MPLDDLIASLGDASIEKRVAAIAGLVSHGRQAQIALAELIDNARAPDIARVWAVIAIGQVGADGSICVSLVRALADPSAALRWAAAHALGSLRAEQAISALSKLLHDPAEVESAWFDDDCTVSQAAEIALQQIGTSAALAEIRRARQGAG